MIENQTFPDVVYIVVRVPKQCPTCDHDLPQFDSVVARGHVMCWNIYPTYNKIEIGYGDEDVLYLDPDQVWLTKEEAEAAAVLERAVPRYWFSDLSLGYVEVVAFNGHYVARCSMWVYDPVATPLTLEQACAFAENAAADNRVNNAW